MSTAGFHSDAARCLADQVHVVSLCCQDLITRNESNGESLILRLLMQYCRSTTSTRQIQSVPMFIFSFFDRILRGGGRNLFVGYAN